MKAWKLRLWVKITLVIVTCVGIILTLNYIESLPCEYCTRMNNR